MHPKRGGFQKITKRRQILNRQGINQLVVLSVGHLNEAQLLGVAVQVIGLQINSWNGTWTSLQAFHEVYEIRMGGNHPLNNESAFK